ncbi:hypothetical protein ACPCIU_18630 [Streptomyces seoulensis]|uniref:hypothetical protein n=1 Tax=Streptomyces seoulensis TaxID=73044 RepID=UPI003C2CA505
MSVINWGDVPTWLGTVFAAAAAGAAVWTLKSQRDQIQEQRVFIAEQSATMELERAELRSAAEDRRWAQARRVRMHHQPAWSTPDAEGNAGPDDHWVVIASNGSDAPVHQVEVRFGSAYTAAEAYELSRESLHAHQGERRTIPLHLVGPSRRVRFHSQRWRSATVHNNRPTLYFTDDGGVRWSLDSYGKLEETEQQPDRPLPA